MASVQWKGFFFRLLSIPFELGMKYFLDKIKSLLLYYLYIEIVIVLTCQSPAARHVEAVTWTDRKWICPAGGWVWKKTKQPLSDNWVIVMLVQVWICMTYVVIAVLGKMQVFVDVYSMCLDVCIVQSANVCAQRFKYCRKIVSKCFYCSGNVVNILLIRQE